jgi:hypothetical protein
MAWCIKKDLVLFIVDGMHGTCDFSRTGLGCWVPRASLPLICVNISSCIQISFQLIFQYESLYGGHGICLVTIPFRVGVRSM